MCKMGLIASSIITHLHIRRIIVRNHVIVLLMKGNAQFQIEIGGLSLQKPKHTRHANAGLFCSPQNFLLVHNTSFYLHHSPFYGFFFHTRLSHMLLIFLLSHHKYLSLSPSLSLSLSLSLSRERERERERERAVTQSIRRAIPDKEVLGSIPAVAARSLLVGSVPV